MLLLILLVAALICAILAAFNVGGPWNLLAASFALYLGYVLLSAHGLH